MTEGDVALVCMAAFVGGLVDAGVRDACVSPGSRSTPLALALARHPGVRVHVHLDERSSAFFALGLSKATGRPAAVACTSGTAAANVFPAAVEASMARVPLVVLTADRPPELRGVGANQTIDQIELYGRHVRSFLDAPVPGEEPVAGPWRRRGAQAATVAASFPAGPVHVNLPFREPLVPAPQTGAVDAPASAAAPATVTVDTRSSTRRPPTPSVASAGPTEDRSAVERLVADIGAGGRGLVYAGGLRAGGEDVVAIARTLRWPLVAEPHSGARRPGALAAGQLLLASEPFVERWTPEVVLQIGAAPTSRAGLAVAARTPRLLIVDPDDVVADPLRRAARRVVAPPGSVRPALGGRTTNVDEAWASAWRLASERARSAVDALLDGWNEPFEGRVARDVAADLPTGADLCVGSSMPVRDLDLFMRPRGGVRVLANRGASGIDGFVSTTLGVASAGAPTVGLVGDLTLLHDVGALIWNARRGIDVVLVVPNNGGGAIFSTLEQRALPELDELFVTPHGADLGRVARAAGAGHALVERAGDLASAVRAARDSGGVHVVEVRIDAERDRERRRAVRVAVDETLG